MEKIQDNNKILMYLPLPHAKRIKFYIPYPMSAEREAFKRLNTSFYHPHQRLWSLVNTGENIALIKKLYGSTLKEVTLKPIPHIPSVIPSEKVQLELDRNHQKMVLKGFSDSTIKNYQHALGQFFGYFEGTDYKAISKEQIEGFLFQLISKYKISEQKQNLLINAIKCYYEHTLGMPREYYSITRPKRSTDLPNVLSVEEVRLLLKQPENIKHKAILHIMYAAGLRIGEVLRLRIHDIRSDDGYIFIKDSKGKKDSIRY